MKKRAILVMYASLGIGIGILSVYITSMILLLLMVIGVYLVSFLPIFTKTKIDNKKQLVLDTVLIYFLIWIVVFILLTNIL